MKFVIALLCLIPLAYGLLIDTLLDTTEIHNIVNSVVEKFGTNATEQQCETECLVLFKSDVLDRGCDFVCLGIQNLIQKLHTK